MRNATKTIKYSGGNNLMVGPRDVAQHFCERSLHPLRRGIVAISIKFYYAYCVRAVCPVITINCG